MPGKLTLCFGEVGEGVMGTLECMVLGESSGRLEGAGGGLRWP